jgi:hypothetical protein
VKKLLGRTDLEDALKRLDKLTHEEAQVVIAQNLKATHIVDGQVREVAARVVGIDDRVARVEDTVINVNERVAGVDARVAGVDDRVAIVDEKVKAVDNDTLTISSLLTDIELNLDVPRRKGRKANYPTNSQLNSVDQVKSNVDYVKRLSPSLINVNCGS